jgi:hypothetical protein
MGESISAPQPSLPHTRVRLLDEQQYQTQEAGHNYLVVERRYAVHALQTGQLQLGGIRFRGHRATPTAQSPYNRMAGPFEAPGAQPRLVRATSDQAELDVLPPPGDFNGKHWLPARNLQLVESGLNSAGALTAGRPATRHILLIADGLSAAQLPSLELELPEGIKQYPERPHDSDQVLREGVTGSRDTAITLVATDPGSYRLPALEIPWWNTETNRQEIARLPALTLQVSPGQPGFSPARTPQSFATSSDQAEVPFAGLEETWEEPLEQDDASASSWLLWFLAIGWLLTLLGWWRSASRHQRKRRSSTPPAATPAAVAQPPEETEAEILEALVSAYRVTDQEAARKAWLRWGEHVWPKNPPSNLSRLAERCSPKVAGAVLALDKAIYSPAHEFEWVRYSPRELLAPTPAHAASGSGDKLVSV